MAANGLERRSDDSRIGELAGAFEAHVESTRSNFQTLYTKVNSHDVKLQSIQDQVGRIETNTAPIKDIASFFRVIKWVSVGIATMAPIIGSVVWLIDKLGS